MNQTKNVEQTKLQVGTEMKKELEKKHEEIKKMQSEIDKKEEQVEIMKSQIENLED